MRTVHNGPGVAVRSFVAAMLLLAFTTTGDARPRKAKPRPAKVPKAAPAPTPAPTPPPEPVTPQPAIPVVPAPSPDPVPAPAPNEQRETTEDVVLHRQPGERSAAVGKLPKGTIVVVERVEGRWYRVRADKLVGYLTRTTVSGGDVAIEDTTGAWGAQRRTDVAATGLIVHVSAESSTLFAEPRADAPVVGAVARGSELMILEGPRTAGWLHARDERANEGWIRQAHVADGTASVALGEVVAASPPTLAAPSASATITTEPASRGRSTLSVRADAGIGYRVVGMSLSSNGSGGLANYVMSADATAAALDVDVVARVSQRLFVGVDGRVLLARSSPGIDYVGPSGPPGKIPFSTFGTDVGVRVGVTAKQMFEIAVRAGGHYDAFLARDVDNVAMLPRERLSGLTAGVRVDVLPPRSRVSVTGRFDALVIGSRAQTPGLEDGTSSTARAVWSGVTIRVQLAPHLAVLSAYDFGRATTQWTGMSIRDPSVTEARRVDSTQLVQIGLSTDL